MSLFSRIESLLDLISSCLRDKPPAVKSEFLEPAARAPTLGCVFESWARDDWPKESDSSFSEAPVKCGEGVPGMSVVPSRWRSSREGFLARESEASESLRSVGRTGGDPIPLDCIVLSRGILEALERCSWERFKLIKDLKLLARFLNLLFRRSKAFVSSIETERWSEESTASLLRVELRNPYVRLRLYRLVLGGAFPRRSDTIRFPSSPAIDNSLMLVKLFLLTSLFLVSVPVGRSCSWWGAASITEAKAERGRKALWVRWYWTDLRWDEATAIDAAVASSTGLTKETLESRQGKLRLVWWLSLEFRDFLWS